MRRRPVLRVHRLVDGRAPAADQRDGGAATAAAFAPNRAASVPPVLRPTAASGNRAASPVACVLIARSNRRQLRQVAA